MRLWKIGGGQQAAKQALQGCSAVQTLQGCSLSSYGAGTGNWYSARAGGRPAAVLKRAGEPGQTASQTGRGGRQPAAAGRLGAGTLRTGRGLRYSGRVQPASWGTDAGAKRRRSTRKGSQRRTAQRTVLKGDEGAVGKCISHQASSTLLT